MHRRMIASLLVAAVAACSSPTQSQGTCTRADTGSTCSGPAEKATQTATGWHVEFLLSAATVVEYVDNGHQCAFTRYSCYAERHCYITGGGMSETQAIAACR